MCEHGDKTQISIPQTPIQDMHTTNCTQFVKGYRGQKIDKWEAFTWISMAIQSATTGMDITQRIAARGAYLLMLDEHNHLLATASTCKA